MTLSQIVLTSNAIGLQIPSESFSSLFSIFQLGVAFRIKRPNSPGPIQDIVGYH